MFESIRKRQRALVRSGGAAEQLQAVDTLGGRMHVGWDAGAAATPHGQLVFFAEFLAATGATPTSPRCAATRWPHRRWA